MRNPKANILIKLFGTGLALLFLCFWPGTMAQTQVPPQVTQPPPPPPAPGIPSIEEAIRCTRHNLSSIEPINIQECAEIQRKYGTVPEERRVFAAEAAGSTEVCVFCHTPHGAVDVSGVSPPLWNRNLSSARYILYDQVWSTSLEAYASQQKPPGPTGYSRLCLSCHDGTIALGTVVNAPGSGGSFETNFFMQGVGPGGTMPSGSGLSTGDTRLIGTNLQNDHPISFVYDSNLAQRDEELVDPGPPLIPPSKVGDPTLISPLRRYSGLDPNRYDSVQCTSCHNPHAATYPKFLRTSYFNNDPKDPNYGTGAGKILCLYCHDKPGWTGSSHDADTFTPPPSPSVENPYNFSGSHTVGQYACRACHDPHTAQGAKRILREGVDANNNFAIENTCFLCHKPATELVGGTGIFPPDIRSEFKKGREFGGNGSAMSLILGQGHEPVFVARPQEGVELFSPVPPAFNEESPGTLIQDSVHVECVDCHNPHQVTRTNRLKGMKGIDINGKVVGSKIPGNSREPYVYEICLRCHGNSYTNLFVGDRYPDDTIYRSDPQDLSPREIEFSFRGFSNKRKEFDPATSPLYSYTVSNITSVYTFPQNPSFHPVAAPGRNGSPQLCQQLARAFDLYDAQSNPGGHRGNCDTDPANALKMITIQCTDCHNNNAFGDSLNDIIQGTPGISNTMGPITGLPDGTSYRRSTDSASHITQAMNDDASKPQGPHGSANIRILRNVYNTDIRNPGRSYFTDGKSISHFQNFLLCFQCHDTRAFVPGNRWQTTTAEDPSWTNFFGNPWTIPPTNGWDVNLHMYHLRQTGAYCHECHNNVHSNVEAVNTIYGDGTGRIYPNCGMEGSLTNPPGCLPEDSEDGISDGIVDTHLLNFAPGVVSGLTADKPRWFYTLESGVGIFRCDLACHGINMSTCHYKPSRNWTNKHRIGEPPQSGGDVWCAGSGWGEDMGSGPTN